MNHGSPGRAIAIVGLGAILPDAMNVSQFWDNILNKRYSITEVPSDRWRAADYYDPDPAAPDKTYSKIGGWVKGFDFNWKEYRIPPRVAAAMDESQKWAVEITAQALADYGYPQKPLDSERTAVVLGNAMGGEMHYMTSLRIYFPEYARALQSVSEFNQLPEPVRRSILERWHAVVGEMLPPVTEDSMPGELSNIVSGRVANIFNLRGPNYITDAACAASLAAFDSAVELLTTSKVDAVITGGVDRNMGVSSFIKFCKIGALSATGTRPFGKGADGFVMGEGSAAFLLKRLEDAERDNDKIYAVIRGVGGASDGKGKGIYAPNPAGQMLAIQRAWQIANLDPATATLVEAHGTSTRVGDVVEVESLASVFCGAPPQSIGLGSVKSNFGHLKAGAGAAGMLKATLSVYHKILPPTLNAQEPNPDIDFRKTPFYVNHEAREWASSSGNGTPRRCGISAYGFGGTNFHVVLEEHIPGALTKESRTYRSATLDQADFQVSPSSSKTSYAKTSSESVSSVVGSSASPSSASPSSASPSSANPSSANPSSASSAIRPSSAAKPPVRGILALGGSSPAELKDKLEMALKRVQASGAPAKQPPEPTELRAPQRIVIDYGSPEELIDRIQKSLKAISADSAPVWKALQAQGIFRGSGSKPGKVAFLFPGQGSQYTNMGRQLLAIEPVVAQVFEDGDRVMASILEKKLSSYVFINTDDPEAVRQAEFDLMQTAITQPAMLTIDTALFRLLGEFGFRPDMVMGHSLGEYGALIAAGVMPFSDALEAVAARGREMASFNSVDDNGWMAAVMAPYEVIQETISAINGYVVAANINSYNQCVIGGASKAVEQAIQVFQQKGYDARRIPVSHAFHTRIVAPASKPLRHVLNRLRIYPPQIPIIANVTGDIYPTNPDAIRDILEQQVASTVQWVKGLETLYANGVRTFVEVGPKKALKGFVDDVLGSREDVVSLFTNHPKVGELVSFNQALCGLYATGYGLENSESRETRIDNSREKGAPVADIRDDGKLNKGEDTMAPSGNGSKNGSLEELTQLLAQAIQQATAAGNGKQPQTSPRPTNRNDIPLGSVVITGTGLGLPGAEKAVMDPDNAQRILRGEQFVDLIPERFRKKLVDKRVTRVVKAEDGSGSFEVIQNPEEVIRLAGRPGYFNLHEEYGVPDKLIEALDFTTQLAMAAGLDALREASIPLVLTYKQATTGKWLPDRWMLPEALRDETGVVFASAFPGNDRLADEFERYYTWQNRLDQLHILEELRCHVQEEAALEIILSHMHDLRDALEREPYEFDRRFLFRVLSMGHSQFAEYIGARGPNTQVNAACSSTAQAIGLAEDWIRTGRCRRVIVLGADVATSDHLLEWIGAGFLASGAAATDDIVEEAALPFDKRRHGTLMGMGACALVLESEDAVRERGMRGIVELLSTEINNSAFHGTRLNVEHIAQVMDNLVTSAERRFGIHRYTIAPQTVFMSHETFTPARGGSASAEVVALRKTFGDATDEIVVANTKGFTGHPMGVGVEDVIAVKILEYGIVPPVPNLKEYDPDLGPLNLSRGGRYPVQFALHLSAGFGSQIAMTMTRRIPGKLDRVDSKARYQQWLAEVSGYDWPETEVVKRVLRIKDQGHPSRRPAASAWEYGNGPVVRTVVSDSANSVRTRSAIERNSFKETMDDGDAVARRTTEVEPSSPDQRSGNGFKPSSFEQPTPPAVPLAPVEKAPAPSAAPAASPVEPTPVPATNDLTPLPSRVEGEAAPAPKGDEITERVLAIVAEKTGYPKDMLALDLDLEADLGVDTVKQAETFSALREAFDIPRQENLKLRDYPTLEHVIAFVKQMRPDLVTSDQGFGTREQRSASSEQAPAPAAPTPTMQPTPTMAPSSADEVIEKVLSIVAEKTGYPKDMLELDLDLEADLGVDTVKQAETFSALREAFDIPRQENLKLRDYPTLEHVIAFVKQMRPDLAVSDQRSVTSDQESGLTPLAPIPLTEEATAAPQGDEITDRVLSIVSEKTGYPKDMLELDLDLEADLGVDTVKQAETFSALREAFDIPRQENLKLRDYPTLAHVISFVKEMRPDLMTSDQGLGTREQRSSSSEQEQNLIPPVPLPLEEGEAAPTPKEDVITERVMEIVAEKTGYPKDMLELDLDLEADLGVDTVKQAETFSALREAFAIPRQENLKLRDYPTLAHVIAFVKQMRPDLAHETMATQSHDDGRKTEAEPSSSAISPLSTEQPPSSVLSPSSIEAADRVPRRVPVPVLRPATNLCKPTGVKLDETSRVVVAADQGGVGKALINRLEKRGVKVLAVPEAVGSDELDAMLKSWLEEGPIQGVYWLTALDVEPSIEEMDLETWRELNRQRVKNLYRTMRTLYESVREPGSFLVSATRLGGLHGYRYDTTSPYGATAPLGGAVTGFTKAYKRERGQVTVKAVDFEPSRKTAELAEALIAETLNDPGIVEVGYRQGDRFSVTLVEQPAADGNPGLLLGPETVFAVTGAAGGITSAIIRDLAAASRGIFYLLDLVPPPDPQDPLIRLFRQDKEALKFKLIEDGKASGERLTPVKVEKEIQAIERKEAALRAIESVQSAGGQAFYRQVDLMDGPSVTAVVDEIRTSYHRIDVLVHAAGVEISRSLPDKDPRQFDLVFGVKADGFYNLLHAAKGMPIGATVAFSSVAGRFGNAGQTDYSSANDLLCKITSSLRGWRPETRGIVIDWTAWAEIGMATRGSIPKIMEMAGIEMLSPEAGIPTIRRELVSGGRSGEIVVAGKLGIMTQELDETGGLDVEKAAEWLAQQKPPLLMVGQIKAATLYGGLEVETTLDPKAQPFLYDHAMDGTPLLPGVMGTEAFAQVASVLADGYRAASVENEVFERPFKFYQMQPQTLYFTVNIHPVGESSLLATATLKSRRALKIQKGDGAEPEIQEKTHFSANVQLDRTTQEPPQMIFSRPPESWREMTAKDIYRVYFHGPAYQVLESAQFSENQVIGLLAAELPANSEPAGAAELMTPRLIELCLQTAGVWEMQNRNVLALPTAIGSASVFGDAASAQGRLFALVTAEEDGAYFDAQVVDENGKVYLCLSGYRTVQLPVQVVVN